MRANAILLEYVGIAAVCGVFALLSATTYSIWSRASVRENAKMPAAGELTGTCSAPSARAGLSCRSLSSAAIVRYSGCDGSSCRRPA